MTDNNRETPQPVYFLCDASVRMGHERRDLADSLMGYLVAEIADNALLSQAVRWGIEHYGVDGGTTSVLPLQQVDFTDVLPPLHTSVEEPDFTVAAAALRKRMSEDISQLDADYATVNSPYIVVLTSGVFAAPGRELDDAVSGLLTTNPRIDQDRGWDPKILFLGLDVQDPEPLERLARQHPEVGEFAVATEEDASAVAAELVDIIWRTVTTGVLQFRYARFVIAEKELTIGDVVERTAGVEVHEVLRHPVGSVLAPLLYRRFTDADQDAEAHPFDALLDLVAVGEATPYGREPITGKALWPVRLVVGDDPRVARGLLVPELPAQFADADSGGPARPRSIGLLALDHATPPPGVPGPADLVARARIGEELAGIVWLAHQHGVVLGDRAIDSAVFCLTAQGGAEVRLSICDDARVVDGSAPEPRFGDLVRLGRVVESCAEAVLDTPGRDLLGRAKSNVPRLLPPAARWRDYLGKRAVQLQGPPVLGSLEVEPAYAPSGAAVVVSWRTRYTDELVLVGADGRQVPVPAKDIVDGHASIVVTRPGPVTLYLRNKVAQRPETTEWVHVFELPRLTEVTVPVAPIDPAAHHLDELADLVDSVWGFDGRPLAEAFSSAASTFDVQSALSEPRRRSPRPLLRRIAFPYDVGSWFLQRPAKSPSRPKKWWRLP